DGRHIFQGSRIYDVPNEDVPDFHWSTTRKLNGSLSLGFFHDRLLVDFTGYSSSSDDQLINSALASQSGFTSIIANAPYTVQNSGWEVTVRGGAFKVGNGDFTWNAPSFNIGKNNNKIVKIA